MTVSNENLLTAAQVANLSYSAYLQPSLSGYTIVDHTVGPGGFEAIAYKSNSSNDIYVGFAGSGASVVDLMMDWYLYNRPMSFSEKIYNFADQAILAKQMVIDIGIDHPNARVIVSGHSLGGYLAQIVANELSGIDAVVTFNSPGLGGFDG